MSLVSNTVLAFSMSADAFAAAIGKGMGMKKPRFREAIRIGAIFGIVETITPLIGWVLGTAASGFVTEVDHWIAFVILGLIGGKMIHESLRQEEEIRQKKKKESHRVGILVLTAVGTSIDALAVGVTLAFLSVNIWVTAIMIGMATFLMATLGIMTGHYLGLRAGRVAEGLGGLCLIMVGTAILVEHLGLIAA